MDYDNYNFFEKLLAEEFFTVLDGIKLRIKFNSDKIWGFRQNGVLFIYWNEEFNQIPTFGTISHFIAYKTFNFMPRTWDSKPHGYYWSISDAHGSPYDSDYPSTVPTETELRQYILDMETGEVMNYTYENIEIILMRDTELYEEFVKLRKKQRKKMKFLYLRKYNEKHPFYIHEEY